MSRTKKIIGRSRSGWWVTWPKLPLIGSAILALIHRGILIHKDAAKYLDVWNNTILPEKGISLDSRTLEELKRYQLPHGDFFFGPHSHSIQIPPNEMIERLWTPDQQILLNDTEIDVGVERARCASYNFPFPEIDPKTPIKRRRLFLGSLIADDSLEVLAAVGTEAYNIFHSVIYIEGNVTQNLTPRKWRYLEDERPSKKLHQLYQLFGPRTKVSIGYYITSRDDKQSDEMLHEKLQKDGIVQKWKLDGMQPDDVAIVSDTDETFTRDFLRALQICDVPQFRPNQSCESPKYIGATLVMEGSSKCIVKGRRWYHPDAMIGECVDLIGNANLHKPAQREYVKGETSFGDRAEGYGKGNYSLYNASSGYPLWSASDVRTQAGGTQIHKKDGSPTGYHFHNWFRNAREIHFKYSTYGHAIRGGAMDMPIWEMHEDLALAVNCSIGKYGTNIENFTTAPGNARPIYYLNDTAQIMRHKLWQGIVKEETEKYMGNQTLNKK